MFTEAIEKATKYTKAIHIISRNYGSTIIQPGTATLFIVNSECWLLTCSHVAGMLAAEKDIIKRAEAFMTEFTKRKGTIKYNKLINELEKKYGYSKKVTFEFYFHFMNCVDKVVVQPLIWQV